MSKGKIYLGDILVSNPPDGSITITSNGTVDVTDYEEAVVNVPGATLQTKTVSPTESQQTVTPDSGYNGLSQVTVNAISSTYVGSGVTRKSAQTYTPTTSNQTIPSGRYLTGTQTIQGSSNLTAGNIKKDVTIFGVTGTYEGSGGGITWLDNPNNYLSFKFIQGGKFYWKTIASSWVKTIQYMKNNSGTWTSVQSSVVGYVCDVAAGDEIWVKGTESSYGSSGYYCSFFNNGFAYVSGSMASLKSGSLNSYCFKYLFSECNIDIHPDHLLVLPATSLATYCYQYMFYNCKPLTLAPALPATTLTNCCYQYMFSGCSSLITPPTLSATSLANYCCSYMFHGCTSLTTAPTLSATSLSTYCYQSMFNGCTSLTTAPALPATTLANSCYNGMFRDCTSLTTAPSELPATTLATYCYSQMFYGCTNLTNAPKLPATTLTSNCYYNMFNNCSKIDSVTCLATSISASSCLTNWLNGVKSTGTFYKAASMSSWPRSTSGIPTGWTVQDYTESGSGSGSNNENNYIKLTYQTASSGG